MTDERPTNTCTDAFPEGLRSFVDNERWTYAKTMPEWPHEYLVRGRVDSGLFEETVKHIRANGYEGRFYQKTLTYYDEAGLVYWTMGAPVEETTIINRCRKEDTFESRSSNGTLPGRDSGRDQREVAMSESRGDTANLLSAIECASRKHSTQRRKDEGASPYINHPIAVTHLVADTGGITDIVTLMAAVLHDTIEDTETTAEELEAQFGRVVRTVVEELTDDKQLDKAERKQLQIDHAPGLSPRAKAIKLADKIAVQDVTDCPPADWDLTRRIGYLDWTEKVVAGCRGANAALEKLYDEMVERGRAKFRG